MPQPASSNQPAGGQNAFRDLSAFDLCNSQSRTLDARERTAYEAAVERVRSQIAAEPKSAEGVLEYALQVNSEGAALALKGTLDNGALQRAAYCIKQHVDGLKECQNPALPLLLAASGNQEFESLLIQAAGDRSKFGSTPGGKKLREFALQALGDATSPEAQELLFKTMIAAREDAALRNTAAEVLQRTASHTIKDRCEKLCKLSATSAAWEMASVAPESGTVRKVVDWMRLNSFNRGDYGSILKAANLVAGTKPGAPETEPAAPNAEPGTPGNP